MIKILGFFKPSLNIAIKTILPMLCARSTAPAAIMIEVLVTR